MKRKSMWATLLCLAVVAIITVAAAPAGAVVGGQQDTGNKYSNVGMNLEFGYWDPGLWGFAGSCTLIKNAPGPGGVVVMTAAHALWGETPAYIAENWRVTFDPLTDYDWFMTIPGGLPADLETYGVVASVMHPGFDVDTPYRANSKKFTIGPGREDVALMWLDRQVVLPDTTTPVLPAPIVGLRGLDVPGLKNETFTAVGYGLNDFLVGSVMSSYAGGRAVATWNGRNYKEVSVIAEGGVLADRFLTLTNSVSAWDSGGPLFRDDTIVGLHSAVQSGRNASPGFDYRLDTASAQDFINDWLVHGPPE
jgi:hypothetical protein